MKRPAMIDQAARENPAALILFDVLQVGKRDMRKLPLQERKRWLRVGSEVSRQFVFGLPLAAGTR